MTHKTRQLLLLFYYYFNTGATHNINTAAIKSHEMQLNDLNMNQFQSHIRYIKNFIALKYDLLLHTKKMDYHYS